MNYWQFRLRLYNQSLKQWLESLKQMSIGLIALFPLALPALVFLPFVAWGVLADASTDNILYLKTLWAYLLFVYSWMSLQRDGILATQHQCYVNSLAVSQSKRLWCELGLIVYSANVLILGPLCLLLLMVYQGGHSVSTFPIAYTLVQLTPILGLLGFVSYYSVHAIRVQTLPWLSLLVMPLIMLPWAADFAKGQWLVLWVAGILLERQLPMPAIHFGQSLQGFYRLLLQADINNPRSEGLRFVALILLTLMLSIMFDEVKAEARSYVAGFLSFSSALLLASSLFNIQALRREYQLYFASLPLTDFSIQCRSIMYSACKALPGIIVLAYMGIFSLIHWALWSVFYVTSLLGIMYRPNGFFIPPVISAVVIFILLA